MLIIGWSLCPGINYNWPAVGLEGPTSVQTTPKSSTFILHPQLPQVLMGNTLREVTAVTGQSIRHSRVPFWNVLVSSSSMPVLIMNSQEKTWASELTPGEGSPTIRSAKNADSCLAVYSVFQQDKPLTFSPCKMECFTSFSKGGSQGLIYSTSTKWCR